MGNISGEILKTSEKSFLEKITMEQLFSISQKLGFACAIYRLPNRKTKHLIIDLSSGKDLDNLHLEEMGSGFIFHPFSADHHLAKFINKDIHVVQHDIRDDPEIVYAKVTPDELYQLFNDKIPRETDHESKVENRGSSKKINVDEKNAFIKLINNSIHEINSNRFQKVVLARNKNIKLPHLFNAFEFFESLAENYTNSFIYLTFIPGVGSWIGATPETLINIDENRQFQTVALAATQAYRKDVDLEETTWSQKDIEEQAMVSRYIINCFKKIRLREFEEIGPRTHLSGNLVHLKTDYNVDMDQVAFPQLGTVMLELLHPTSAVCGMPKEPALEFILQHEGFDREYFSGFLGPVNMLDETNIYVNLRCMKIMPSQGILFSGAGIISNSNPEKEWNETEIKMDTLLKVLNDLH